MTFFIFTLRLQKKCVTNIVVANFSKINNSNGIQEPCTSYIIDRKIKMVLQKLNYK